MKGNETMKKQRNKQITKTPVVPKIVSQPSSEEIAKRAHEIFLARGGAPGFELDDWLQAERELKAASRQRAE
jgi:hypothetical protein